MPARKGLTQDDVREIALALPETTVGSHMGHPDLRVRDKIFGGLTNDGKKVNLRITTTVLDMLVQQDPETFRDAWGGKYVGVEVSRVSRKQLSDLIHEAWRLTAPPDLGGVGTKTRARRK